MRSSSIRNIRRAELSVAAFEAVIEYGLRRTTLDKVGNKAGLSKGVVLHHFKDKSALLAAVFRRSNSLLSESVMELYKYAESPYERLWAIIVANFFGSIFNHRVCQAWVSLISEVPHNHECQRIQIACNNRIGSNLRHELKHLLEPEEAKSASKQLGILIDGLWMRGGLSVEPVESSAAISDIEFALSKLVPFDEVSKVTHHNARKKIEGIAKIVLGSKAFKERSYRTN
jgi:TetR/AcrR family transcriptional repressor of bet genes